MKINTVGVIGAGVMGQGVAQSLAQTGHRVLLIDVSDEVLSKAEEKIKENIRQENLFNQKREKNDGFY